MSAGQGGDGGIGLMDKAADAVAVGTAHHIVIILVDLIVQVRDVNAGGAFGSIGAGAQCLEALVVEYQVPELLLALGIAFAPVLVVEALGGEAADQGVGVCGFTEFITRRPEAVITIRGYAVEIGLRRGMLGIVKLLTGHIKTDHPCQAFVYVVHGEEEFLVACEDQLVAEDVHAL